MPITWCRHPEVAYVDDAGRVAMLALHHLERPPVILEGSSAVIWRLIEVPIDQDSVILRVAEHFETPTDDVAGPVKDFLEELRTRDLAVSESAP